MPRPDLPASTDVAPKLPSRAQRNRDFWTAGTTQSTTGAHDASQSRPPVNEQEERLCRDDLRKLGVDFEPHEPLADPVAGCFVVNPVTLKSLGKTIKLSPEAVLNCDMARATARFMQDVAAPAAKASFGVELTSIGHDSGLCLPATPWRRTKLSEHGLGNAIDIASFGLSDGTPHRCQGRARKRSQRRSSTRSARRRAARSRPCSARAATQITTLHFHFDLGKRRNGSTFCQ